MYPTKRTLPLAVGVQCRTALRPGSATRGVAIVARASSNLDCPGTSLRGSAAWSAASGTRSRAAQPLDMIFFIFVFLDFMSGGGVPVWRSCGAEQLPDQLLAVGICNGVRSISPKAEPQAAFEGVIDMAVVDEGIHQRQLAAFLPGIGVGSCLQGFAVRFEQRVKSLL